MLRYSSGTTRRLRDFGHGSMAVHCEVPTASYRVVSSFAATLPKSKRKSFSFSIKAAFWK